MTPDWLERELSAAIQEFQVNVLVAARTAFQAVLAPVVVESEKPGARRRPPTSSRAMDAALRGRIVEFVRGRTGVTVGEIASAIERHVATARRQANALVSDGLLRTEPGRPEAPGRPALVYFVTSPNAASEPSDAVAVAPASQEVLP